MWAKPEVRLFHVRTRTARPRGVKGYRVAFSWGGDGETGAEVKRLNQAYRVICFFNV